MKLRELFYLVWRNLLRMKVRVAMTAGGVLIGTAAVVLVVSLGVGLQRANTESMAGYGELTELNVYSPVRFAGFGGMPPGQEEIRLDDKALKKFRGLPGVVAVSPLVYLEGAAELRWKRYIGFANITGIEAHTLEMLDYEYDSGVARLGNWQAVIGVSLLENLIDPRTGRPPDRSSRFARPDGGAVA